MRFKGIDGDFEAVIFDLDGTLVDSMWMWTDIDIEYLKRFGHGFDRQLQLDIAGMNVNETAAYFKKTYGIPLTEDEIISDWIAMSIDKYRHDVHMKPGAFEFLSFIRENGLKTAVASSNAMEMIEACLNSNSIYDKFDAIVTASQVERGKPAPDVYLKAAELIGVEPGRCLVFEDIPAGIMAGKAAGMTVVAVHDRFSEDAEDEKHALSDLYVQSMRELL